MAAPRHDVSSEAVNHEAPRQHSAFFNSLERFPGNWVQDSCRLGYTLTDILFHQVVGVIGTDSIAAEQGQGEQGKTPRTGKPV